MSETRILTGPLPTEIASKASDLIAMGQRMGLDVDEVLCVVVTVAADYGRVVYGDDYLEALAEILVGRADAPPPDVTTYPKVTQ